MATTTATQIQQLYVGLLGRAADQGGLNWWADQVTTGGKTLEDVRASFVTSTEYTTTYGAAATRADLVTSIYQNLFERTPSADEVKYWAETDTRPADQLVAAFIEFAGAADQAVINNKTFVAQTYTDTVGNTYFDKAGAADVIANVDGTTASVTAALSAISNGTVAGQVPGLALINAVTAADAAVIAFETSNQAAVNALAEKLESDASGSFSEDLSLAADAAGDARNELDVTVGGTYYSADGLSTSALTEQGKTFDAAEATKLAALSTSQQNLAATYKAAIAAEATADAGKATPAEQASVVAGLAKDETATEGLKDLATDYGFPDASQATTVPVLYGIYVNGTYAGYEGDAAQLRSEVDAALKGSTYYPTFKAAVAKDAAYADAQKTTLAAEEKLTDTDTTNGNTKAADYLATLGDKTQYSEFLAKVVAADVNVNAVKAISDPHDTTVAQADAAHAALTAFTPAGVHLGELTSGAGGTSDTVKDVFYFGSAADAASSSDYSFANFKTGDSIVLGNSYSYNSGALSTGDNNTLEFFLVKGDAGVQLVVETAKYGSDGLTPNATTGVIAASGTDHAQVITLTGVTAEHVSVANGVVSYVA